MSNLVDIVTHEGAVLAYLVRGDASPAATTFVTPGTEQLQLGLIVYRAGTSVQAHEHLPVERVVTSTPEAVMVKKGRCTLELYDAARKVIATREMTDGDIVLLLRGGHGFRVHEDTLFMEIKQGPHKADEKVRF